MVAGEGERDERREAGRPRRSPEGEPGRRRPPPNVLARDQPATAGAPANRPLVLYKENCNTECRRAPGVGCAIVVGAMALGTAIRRARARGLTYRQIADRYGCGVTTVERYCRPEYRRSERAALSDAAERREAWAWWWQEVDQAREARDFWKLALLVRANPAAHG